MSDTNLVEEFTDRTAKRQGDLTQGPILRTLVLFSLPSLFANILQTMGGTINTIWVGQLLGEGAVAATANANMVMFVAFAAVFGFGTATSVRIGQHFGARDIDRARRTFGSGTGFCLAFATAMSVAGWIFADPLLRLMATPAAIHDDALSYLRVVFVSLPFGALWMMISTGMRGVGDASSPLYAMILTTIVGIVLNPLLILGVGPIPPLGIAGSALALAASSLVGAVALVAWAYWRRLPLRLAGREIGYLLPTRDELGYVLSKGIPMGAQMMVTTSASLVMVGLVNREGMLSAAAFAAVLQIWNYIQMPAFAVSMAVSAMVAQNIGASQHDRVGTITLIGVGTNTVVTVLLTASVLMFDGPLLMLFLGEGSAAIPIAERIQLLATWSWVLTGMMTILSGTMRAYGVVMAPLLVFIVALYPARLGFYELSYPLIGADALWWAYPFGSAVALALTWLVYTRRGWRRDQLPSLPAAAAAAE